MALIISYSIIFKFCTQVVLVAFMASSWLIVYTFLSYIIFALGMTLTRSEVRCTIKFPHSISGNKVSDVHFS